MLAHLGFVALIFPKPFLLRNWAIYEYLIMNLFVGRSFHVMYIVL